MVTLTGASNLIDMSYANPSADSAKDQSPFTVTLGPSDSKKIMIQNIYESDQVVVVQRVVCSKVQIR